MPSTTPINALRYAVQGDAPDANTLAQNLASDVDSKMIPRFATNAARDAAITSPVDGQLAYTTDEHLLWRYDSTLVLWIWAFPQVKTVSPDQQNSSTTMQTVSSFDFNIIASRSFHFEIEIGYTGPSAANVKTQFSFPANSTLEFGFIGTSLTHTAGECWNGWTQPGAAAATAGTGVYLTAGSPQAAIAYGRFVNGAAAGTVHWQFAQNTANGAPVWILQGSKMRITMIG